MQQTNGIDLMPHDQQNCLFDAGEVERLSTLTTSLVEAQQELTREMEQLTKALTEGFGVGKLLISAFKHVTTVFLLISLGLLTAVVFMTGTRLETKTIKIQPTTVIDPSRVQPAKPEHQGSEALLPTRYGIE